MAPANSPSLHLGDFKPVEVDIAAHEEGGAVHRRAGQVLKLRNVERAEFMPGPVTRGIRRLRATRPS